MTPGGTQGEDRPLVNPALAPEYLRSLQDGLDAAQEQVEAQRLRIARLERDRATLRDRLAAAQTPDARGGLLGRLRSGASADTADTDTDAGATVAGTEAPGTQAGTGAGSDPAAENGTVTLPVVGTLGPVRWPDPAPTRDLRMAVVADEFTSRALEHEASCVHLHAENAVETLRRERPDVLFVESAYRGAGRSWQRRIARFGAPHPQLMALVDAARELDVPTVFWNKEDPVNSDWFTATAALFDHVFTVDEGLVDTYRARFGHDRVHALPFAAQPAIHTPPADPSQRTGPILFAGTWFATKHPERRDQMTMLLDPARPRGLHLLDRHAGGDPRFAWPERFREHIVGSLPYPLAVEATRRYQVVVNVNTVTDSATMCARRVFELAACATPVVSGPSLAVERTVPADAIRVVRTTEEAADAYDELLGDPRVAAQVGEAARAWVVGGHTWAHRLDSVMQAVAAGRS